MSLHPNKDSSDRYDHLRAGYQVVLNGLEYFVRSTSSPPVQAIGDGCGGIFKHNFFSCRVASVSSLDGLTNRGSLL